MAQWGVGLYGSNNAYISRKFRGQHYNSWRDGVSKAGGVAVNKIETWDFANKCDYDDDIQASLSYNLSMDLVTPLL